MIRTNNCGELTAKDLNQVVILQGWVKKVRKLGGLTFLDLRDRYGYTQVVVEENQAALVKGIKPEYVLEVKGIVKERKAKNAEIATGEIEVVAQSIKVINPSVLPPFMLEDDVEVSEETRLKYRYLDLRRPKMQHNLIMRAQVNHLVRNFLVDEQFLEIETPAFGKSTPEGARDFLVPSRLNPGKFYALPQSPQLFKQLLMIGGYDLYFQIVKCFRDEDLRIDRQPEFTQLDLEMSFATSDDVMNLTERLLKKILQITKNIKLDKPFLRISYQEAIDKYGVDKPDLRFDLPLKTLTSLFTHSENKLMQKFNQEKAEIRGIALENELLNKGQIKIFDEISAQFNLPSLGILKLENQTWTGSLASTLTQAEKTGLLQTFGLDEDAKATILISGGKYHHVSHALGEIRNQAGKMFNLYQEPYKLLWVVDFPLFEFSAEENRYVAAHHPFTMPRTDFLATFDVDQENAIADAYDLVMNGFEIGGGSQRITDAEVQDRMFKAIELTPEQVKNNFGWFIEAYQYGAPYHAGLALGMDRIIMLLTGADSIRDVIAFPKNAHGVDVMSNAPDYVGDHQLAEAHLKVK